MNPETITHIYVSRQTTGVTIEVWTAPPWQTHNYAFTTPGEGIRFLRQLCDDWETALDVPGVKGNE